MQIQYYALIGTEESVDAAGGLARVTNWLDEREREEDVVEGDFVMEYLDASGSWIEDVELGRYFLVGEDGAESIDAGKAEEIAKRIVLRGTFTLTPSER